MIKMPKKKRFRTSTSKHYYKLERMYGFECCVRNVKCISFATLGIMPVCVSQQALKLQGDMLHAISVACVSKDVVSNKCINSCFASSL